MVENEDVIGQQVAVAVDGAADRNSLGEQPAPAQYVRPSQGKHPLRSGRVGE